MADVFISYSRKDKEFVSTLYAAFERSNKNIWVDWNDIPLTSDWWLEIEKGIEAADTFLFVISPDSVASNVCAREIHHAVKNNKRLFPIVRRDVNQFEEGNVAHATLQRHNWLMFREDDDFEMAFEKLTKALSQDLEYLGKHKQLLVKAIDWNDSLRTDSLLLREDALYEAEIWLAESKTKAPQATELQEAFIVRSRHIEEEQNREKIVFLENALAKGNKRAKIGSAILVGTIVLSTGAGVWAIKLLNDSNNSIKIGSVKLESVKASYDFKMERNFKSLLQSLSAGKKLKEFNRSSILIKDNSDMHILSSLSQAVYGINEFNQFTFSTIVYSVAFSHNGKMIAIGLEDGTVRLLNLENKELSLLRAHNQKVWSVAFSPDDKMIVTGSSDNTAKLWDIEKRKELQTLKGHSGSVYSVAFSRDRKMIATGSRDNTAKLWNLQGKELRTLKADACLLKENSKCKILSVAFSPDNKTIATGGNDNIVNLWSREGKNLSSLVGHTDSIYSVAFSPNGKMIATASSDYTAKLWNVNDGKELRTLKNHKNNVYSVAFSHDSKMLATGSEDGTTKLWNINDGKELQSFPNNLTVNSIAFSRDDKMIATGSDNKKLQLWRLDKLKRTTFKPQKSINFLTYSPDGKIIATSGNSNIVTLSNLEGKVLKTLTSDNDKDVTYGVAFSPDVNTIAIAMSNATTSRGAVILFDRNGKKLHTLKDHEDRVNTVTFSPDGKTIASGSRDKMVKLWDLNGKLLNTLTGHKSEIMTVAFSHDNKMIATGSADYKVKLWNAEDGKLLQTFDNKSTVLSLAFSPNDRMIATGNEDNTVKLWNLDGTPMITFKGHNNVVLGVAFSPDGKTIASGSVDNTVKLWSLDGTEIQTFQGHEDRIYSVSFSPDGKTIASGSTDGTVILWNLDLDDLMAKGCAWLQDHLTNNPNATSDDRQMCDIEPTQK